MYMAKTFDTAWHRFAGRADNIREGRPSHWRVYAGKERFFCPLSSWGFDGQISDRNCVPGTSTEGDENGLKAWIDVYGRMEVDEEGVATVYLEDPE